jgi:cis-3-alkyl-4-acyloxetan-2-one decarboxylase / olefin beta-lactone synthetase
MRCEPRATEAVFKVHYLFRLIEDEARKFVAEERYGNRDDCVDVVNSASVLAFETCGAECRNRDRHPVRLDAPCPGARSARRGPPILELRHRVDGFEEFPRESGNLRLNGARRHDAKPAFLRRRTFEDVVLEGVRSAKSCVEEVARTQQREDGIGSGRIRVLDVEIHRMNRNAYDHRVILERIGKVAATAPASLPPSIAGLNPSWSRLITTPRVDGVGRTWHVLDNRVADPSITVLCVHGNPTWSYMWRQLIAGAESHVRVVAVDQLEMGFSERTGTTRRLGQRIEDLGALTDHLDLGDRVVTVAHDWGGPISLGWAATHRAQLAAMVLMNTAVHQPAGSRGPFLIRMARLPGVLPFVCVTTPMFIQVALELSRPRLAKSIREGYLAPYRTSARRAGIGDFVRDIPLDPSHPSAEALEKVIADIPSLADLPTLLLWGPSDPVFSDIYLRDLETRLPRADVHRFVGASHLVPEDANVADAVHEWLAQLGKPRSRSARSSDEPALSRAPGWSALDRRSDDDEVAMIEMHRHAVRRSMSFAELDVDVHRVAAGLARHGVAKSDRVALLIPPGIDLTVCLYACWRMGAVPVLVDAGLGARGISRALKSATPRYLIGIPRALAAARLMAWPGERVSTVVLPTPAAGLLRVATTLSDLRALGEDQPAPPTPANTDPAAVIFTSGATGPAKGVVYRHHQLQAQRDMLARCFDIRPNDRFVAAFPPFALYGPAMGVPSVVPDMSPTEPGSLRAVALAEACEAIGATLVFASPAALRSVVATADDLMPHHRASLARVRMVLSAGAPVSSSLLRATTEIMPMAEAHTPYGMTEVLPVSDITPAAIEAAGSGDGVCVGHPLPDVTVAITPLDEAGRASDVLTREAAVTGEVCIHAAHMKESYDQLWYTQHASALPPSWHRSGDVGHLDDDGRLWIEGRMIHIITTAARPVTPVGIEQAVETLPGVARAAAVGVGPPGTQQVVVVVESIPRPRRSALASLALTAQVRSVGRVDIAAVLVVPALPVDKRHNSKIDRTRVASWASSTLAGRRLRAP